MTDTPKLDFHIHTKYLRCANETMELPAIVEECRQLGVTALGITDHLNTLDTLDLHLLIKRDIEALEPAMDVYFGVELNYMAMDGAFAFSQEVKEQYGFQFAIGGIHSTYMDTYDLKTLVDIQHRHHLKTCEDPLVDVLVHPYWFSSGEFKSKGFPWFDSMKAVPESYARELGQVARDTGTAIEINGCANLDSPSFSDRYVKEYVEYLAIIAGEGARFSLGSDAHDIGRLKPILRVWQVAEQLGLSTDRVWKPECPPLVGKA